MKMPPTGAETLQAAKERKKLWIEYQKGRDLSMENGSALFPMEINIPVTMDEIKIFAAADFDDFFAWVEKNHEYVLYRYLMERLDTLKRYIREGGLINDPV